MFVSNTVIVLFREETHILFLWQPKSMCAMTSLREHRYGLYQGVDLEYYMVVGFAS